VFNVASIKSAVDRKFIDSYTTRLQQLDAKLGAEVEVGATVSDAGLFVTELGAGSIIGSELSRYNRPGFRNARFPSQFTYIANGFVDFLVLPKSMIINVNNQVLAAYLFKMLVFNFVKRMTVLKKWMLLLWIRCSSGAQDHRAVMFLVVALHFSRSLVKESLNRWGAYKLQLLGDIRRESKAKHNFQ
jgi:hypothetical protein